MNNAVIRSTFDRVSESLDTLCRMTAKQASEGLAALSVEIRSVSEPSSLLPELAEQVQQSAEALGELNPRVKKGVAEALAPLDAWLTEHYPQDAEVAINRISEIESEIQTLMTSAASALVRVGGLLTEAKEEYDAKDTGAFLAWADSQFGFKKAYVYRLMGVYKRFGHDPVLSKLSVNVLSQLSGADPDKLDKAREMAEAGELTGDKARELVKGVEGAPADAPEREEEQVREMQAAVEGEYQSAEESAGDASVETVRELRGIVADLRDQLRRFQEDAARSKGTRQGLELPSLPQFAHSSYAVRLGLDAEESRDPNKVREAFRGLVKAGYGESHPAFPAIEEARAALQRIIERAA